MTDWPETLPDNFTQDSFYEELPDLDIATPMDAGPPMTRRRFSAGETPMGGQMAMTTAQWDDLVTFYGEVTRSLRFNFIHPVSGDGISVKFDKQPRRQWKSPGRWLVNIDFKVQP